MPVDQDPSKPETIPTGPGTPLKQGPPKKLLHVIDLVRAKLRDHPELNRLVAGREHSNRQIALAVMLTIDDWNITPPLIEGVTLQTFPSLSILINGTIVQLLQSAALLQVRNHMSYSDGQGVSVSTSDKGPQYMAWANMFQQMFEQKKQRLKIAQNLQGAMNGSGLQSEYAFVNGWFDGVD